MFKNLINYFKREKKISSPKMATFVPNSSIYSQSNRPSSYYGATGSISKDRERSFEINKILKKLKDKNGYII